MQHFQKNTIRVSKFCETCGKMTMRGFFFALIDYLAASRKRPGHDHPGRLRQFPFVSFRNFRNNMIRKITAAAYTIKSVISIRLPSNF